jgi:hypothetical protein
VAVANALPPPPVVVVVVTEEVERIVSMSAAVKLAICGQGVGPEVDG